MKLSSIILLLTFVGHQSAHAIPARGPSEFGVLRGQIESIESVDFRGTVGLGGCSGSLVRFADSKPNDRAMVMTNGHCYGKFLNPGEFRVNERKNGSVVLRAEDGSALGYLDYNLVVYATMTKTDVMLLKLVSTFEEIKDEYGIEAFELSEDSPNGGDEIDLISGYWVEGFTCAISDFVYQLKEKDWTWENSIRYAPGCNTRGGFSGSPLINRSTKKVVGIHNTGNEDGLMCKLNNPCEVNENGVVSYEKGLRYGQQTWWLYTCLDDQNEFDLGKDGCGLPGGNAEFALAYLQP
ncbi:MAG: trypsin-like peptidase domain-containing protein [Bdellovibrionales bacterium]|nr:trypsin-like peptidase domain-containing protein [Bdellovibrionales bacterium]